MSSFEIVEQANLKRWQTLQSAVRTERIAQAYDVFRRAGIEPILIKGWAIARFYPAETNRFSADIDLAVHPNDYARAVELLENLKGSTILIDLHQGLRHFDKLPFDELFARSELINLGSAEVRVLRHEDHLRVLCVHWLTDGGANKEKLWDFYYGIANRPDDFDWDDFLNAVGGVRRDWFVSVMTLAHRFLELDVADTPLAGEMKILPVWFVKTIEAEWSDAVKLMPLALFWRKPPMLWKQLQKRFPPNAIHASVMCEAAFDDKSRLPYQIRNFFDRFTPSFKKLAASIFGKK